MGRHRVIFDEFTDLPISEAAKYQRRELRRNPEATRSKRQAKQSTPEYRASRQLYMRSYYAKRKATR